ncbi:MAG TPA: 50S ribosomal protein L16 [Candidatus Babeliales bacterium]|nr:50S ribosomal protein L16 [Candidatus Babeliales bacterium]
MLMPKRTKFRKVQRGTMKGLAKGGREVLYGNYGLQAVEPSWVSAAQIEAMRVTVNRKLKKVGKLFLRIFPDKPITKKPAETRMGKGKGAPEFWVSVVKRGRVLIEIEGLEEKEAKAVLKLASYKLPLKTKFVKRQPKV